MGVRRSWWLIPLLLLILPRVATGAADRFAAPPFAARWQQDEGIVPNSWGPLADALPGRYEPYLRDRPCGAFPICDPAPDAAQRVVQYFDKGRMELNDVNADQGIVTSGRLVAEMIAGTVQTGESRFEQRAPAAVPVAGDIDTPFPLYRDLAAGVPQTASTSLGTPVTVLLRPQGADSATVASGDPQTIVAAIDRQTGHAVPQAFSAFRARAGLGNVGLAVTEPFWADVAVGGRVQRVLIQAFERRVLTYTPTNPEAYRTEFGNVGRQYHLWRYGATG